MIPSVTFDERHLKALHHAAETQELEVCALGWVHSVDGSNRRLVNSLKLLPESAYLERRPDRIVVDPRYLLDAVNEARHQGAGLALAHTHPKGLTAEFSPVDLSHEPSLAKYLESRIPKGGRLSTVITADDAATRELGGSQTTTRSVGLRLRRYEQSLEPAHVFSGSDRYDRQVRAFGLDGQQVLRSLTVAIVGVGGIGSFVATELAHLGVGRLVLVDPDVVDSSNLNRLVGTATNSVGKKKVTVARSAIRRANPDCEISTIDGDVTDAAVSRKLLDVDFTFLCTDGHASRAVVNQIAYQFYVPTIDTGVAVHAREAGIRAIVGRAQMLAPGLPCLVCTQLLDPSRVRREMQRQADREQDPYFVGASAPQPAVISLNGTIASPAVTMFLGATTGIPSSARWIHYDAMHGSMRPIASTPQQDCIVCSERGAIGRGSSWALPTRTAVS